MNRTLDPVAVVFSTSPVPIQPISITRVAHFTDPKYIRANVDHIAIQRDVSSASTSTITLSTSTKNARQCNSGSIDVTPKNRKEIPVICTNRLSESVKHGIN